jgi:hypothetical protein
MIDAILQHGYTCRGIAEPSQPRRDICRLMRLGAQQHPVDARSLFAIVDGMQRDRDRPLRALNRQAVNGAACTYYNIVTIGSAEAACHDATYSPKSNDRNGRTALQESKLHVGRHFVGTRGRFS